MDAYIDSYFYFLCTTSVTTKPKIFPVTEDKMKAQLARPMEMPQILENLCYKDRRHPSWADWHGFLDDPPTPRGTCACDNCHYGRDRLALEILALKEK